MVSGVAELIATELGADFLVKRDFSGLEIFSTPNCKRGKNKMDKEGEVSKVVQAK